MDTLTPTQRSAVMGRVKSSNTSIEIAVRKIIYSFGFRYRLHARDLPGKPDIVFRGRKKVIFVHGCFWHGHQDCKRAKLPTTRASYWRQKIEKNIQRDEQNINDLNEIKWTALVVWQCELTNKENLGKKINDFLRTQSK